MKISIITATYNSGATLRDTLESVLHQDYSDYELLIKDGGSTDDTLDICREYEPRFGGRLKLLSSPDKGPYDAMNQGIRAASGEVVGMLNSDDFFTSKDILRTIARQFEQTPDIDAIYGDVHYVKAEDSSKLVRYYSSRLFRRSWMRFGFMPAHPSFYCRKATYERFKLDGTKIEGFKDDMSCAYYNTSYKIAADFEFLLRTIFVGRIKTFYINKDFVTMRAGGISNSGASSHMQINREHLRALKENGVYSNIFFLSLRYLYRICELTLGWISHMRSTLSNDVYCI
jgi:glycosyltransferase involved in cell wall biosynthesis